MIALSDIQVAGIVAMVAGGIIWFIGAGMLALRKDERKPR